MSSSTGSFVADFNDRRSNDIVFDASDVFWPFVNLVAHASRIEDVRDTREFAQLSTASLLRASLILKADKVWPFGKVGATLAYDRFYDSDLDAYVYPSMGDMFTDLASMYEMAACLSHPSSYVFENHRIGACVFKVRAFLERREE